MRKGREEADSVPSSSSQCGQLGLIFNGNLGDRVIPGKGKEAGVPIHHFSIFLWLRTASRSTKPPAPQACPVYRQGICSRQSPVCQATAENDGRAPKETATLCFYKWGTSLTLSLNLTKILTCNSELKITGFLDNARDGYYEMNKKNGLSLLLGDNAPWVSHALLARTDPGLLCS